MSRNDGAKVSKNLQRKIARQRELEQMEDEAAGVTTTLEISSALAESENGIFLRPRNGNSAPESEIPQPTTVPTLEKNKDLWKRPDSSDLENVNLYDPASAAYQDNSPSISKRFLGLFGGDSRKKSDKHDGSPADPVDFVGDYPRKGTSTRMNPIIAPVYKTFCSTRSRVSMTFFSIILILVMIIIIFKQGGGYVEDAMFRREHTARFHEMYESIVSKGVSHESDFDDYFSPQYHALRWLAYTDPAKLATDSPWLEVRYALAVFYYESFLTFEHGAGRQKAIIKPDDEFYEGVPNPGWVRKDYWLSHHNHCLWWGITCEDKNTNETHFDGVGKIIGLNLQENDIKGTIPKEFQVFHDMKTLDMSKNELHGNFPGALGYNFNLENLNLRDNRLNGIIEPEMSFLEGIREIDMSHNFLTGTIPTELNRLRKLNSLFLSKNSLHGTVPNLANCPLASLSVSHNKLYGSFPAEIPDLTNLRELYINHNFFSGNLPQELNLLTDLVMMHVNHNRFDGTIPNEIFPSLTSLREIHLQNNTFNGPIPPSLGDCSKLEKVHLEDNELTGTVIAEFSNLMALDELKLENNNLNGGVSAEICHLKTDGGLTFISVDCGEVNCACCDNCGVAGYVRRLQETIFQLFM